MQILIFSLIILALIAYVIYKIKNSFTKKTFIGFSTIVILVIAGLIYLNLRSINLLPNSFKAYYLKQTKVEISKLSLSQQNFEIVSSNKSVYNFDYIISKDGKEYVCQAKNIEVIKIEDEYIFNNFKEECKLKQSL